MFLYLLSCVMWTHVAASFKIIMINNDVVYCLIYDFSHVGKCIFTFETIIY